ncbi:hypothetical protein [Micromonospora echinaurantiaca]|uniref:hypothetical protein n=1 Tax=Micromonospora echinaurantiaca TaxID=47857 RepID=UPI00341EA925
MPIASDGWGAGMSTHAPLLYAASAALGAGEFSISHGTPAGSVAASGSAPPGAFPEHLEGSTAAAYRQPTVADRPQFAGRATRERFERGFLLVDAHLDRTPA